MWQPVLHVVPAFSCQLRAATMSSQGKKMKQGYRRVNGRWEARFRPQSRWELAKTRKTIEAYKGYSNGIYKYEFLNYFDTEEEKDAWLATTRARFNRWRDEARARCEGEGGSTFHARSSLSSSKFKSASSSKRLNCGIDMGYVTSPSSSGHLDGEGNARARSMLKFLSARRGKALPGHIALRIRVATSPLTPAGDRPTAENQPKPQTNSIQKVTSWSHDLGILNFFLDDDEGYDSNSGSSTTSGGTPATISSASESEGSPTTSPTEILNAATERYLFHDDIELQEVYEV